MENSIKRGDEMNYAELNKMSALNKIFGNRSIKALPQIIKDDEEILRVFLCSTYISDYFMVVTSKRIFYFRKGFFGNEGVRSVNYDEISAAKLIKGKIKNQVHLITKYSDTKYRFEDPEAAAHFVRLVSGRLDEKTTAGNPVQKPRKRNTSNLKGKYSRRRKLVKDYVVIDFETTGIRPAEEEIIQIGAVKYINHQKVGEFNKLIKPTQQISNRITQITGITNEMVASAPAIKDEIDHLINFIDGHTLVAHHAPFDMGFLYVLEDAGHVIPKYSVLDTLPLSRRTIRDSENHKLVTLAKYLSVEHNAHDALSDCLATAELYQYCYKKQQGMLE